MERLLEKCAVNGGRAYAAEAGSPKEHSKSYKCSDYKPKYDAQAVKTL